jgi:hypothetical protein
MSLSDGIWTANMVLEGRIGKNDHEGQTPQIRP